LRPLGPSLKIPSILRSGCITVLLAGLATAWRCLRPSSSATSACLPHVSRTALIAMLRATLFLSPLCSGTADSRQHMQGSVSAAYCHICSERWRVDPKMSSRDCTGLLCDREPTCAPRLNSCMLCAVCVTTGKAPSDPEKALQLFKSFFYITHMQQVCKCLEGSCGTA
jgi:hypothetical protein